MADAASTSSAEATGPVAAGQAPAIAAVPSPEALVAPARGLPGVRRAGLETGELVIHAERDRVAELMLALRDDPRFACEQMMDLCGVDWPDRAERFDVVYNLLSVSHNHRVRVVVTTDERSPVPSIHQVWPVATWFEREAWDMYGILFAGQPDLRRILTDYGFSGHPLRKDFPLSGHVEVRYDEERKQVIYQPVSLTQDFRNFDYVSPWEGMVTLPGDEKVHQARKAIGIGTEAQSGGNKDNK